MNFDLKDYRFLRLCGLCRYIPTDLWRYYNSELFSATSMFTLEDRGYIKMQTNGMSYKLTYKGREVLEEMGFTYAEDMRMDTKRAAYKRRLMLAHCNVTMHLAGKDLEELWNVTHPPKQSEKLPRGMTLFDRALEELGYDYLLVPTGRNGVTQLSVMKLRGYRHRLATALGRVSELPWELSFCDNIIDGEPFIFTIDMNVKRIERALRQLKRYDSSIIPNICSFPFQKDVVSKIVKMCGFREKKIYTLEKEMVEAFFPETAKEEDLTKPYITKEGRYVCADEKKVKRTNSKASET